MLSKVISDPQRTDLWDIIFSFLLNGLIVLLFCFVSPGLLHWCLIPVFLSGCVIGVDAISWFRKKMDLFDPKGILGLFGIQFFLVDPLLAASAQRDLVDAPSPPDWRLWIGKLYLLLLVGLIIYQFIQRLSFRKSSRAERFYWRLDAGKAAIALPLVLSITLAAHLFFMVRLGGIQAFLMRATYGAAGADVVGLGPVMVFGRSFPLLVIIAITVYKYKNINRNSNLFIVFAIGLFMFFVILFFYGLETSRSTLVWGLAWVLGIIHFFWRKMTAKWIVIALIPFLGFMYIYGFYKNLGMQVFDLFRGEVTLESLEAKTGRTMESVLMGDLGRTTIQASILYSLYGMDREYRYRLGSTYLSSAVPLIPRRIWPTKPTDSGKVIAATELFHGPGSYVGTRSEYRSTRIFALAGEAMLNYGIWGIPVAFAAFGYLMARTRRRLLSYYSGDMRLLTAPFLVILLLLILSHDLANVAMQTLFNWVIPAIAVLLCSRRAPLMITEDGYMGFVSPEGWQMIETVEAQGI